MFNALALSTSLLFVLAVFSNAVVVPAPAPDVVEVIPGPGLPSLADLGLTSADLANPMFHLANLSAPLEPRSTLERRWTNTCQTFKMVNRGNAVACYNYLVSIGSSACSLSGDNTIFVQAGDAAIWGTNIAELPSVSSLCSDVAKGAAWILDNCSTCSSDNCLVQGDAAANGNGNLVVSIESVSGA